MEDLFAGRVKFENPSSKNPGSMKDSLTGLDRYEVFLKKLQTFHNICHPLHFLGGKWVAN